MGTEHNKRLEYLDGAKALLIILVIAGHVLIVLNPSYDKLLLTCAQEFIYAFHMSAFFILHGVLFRTEKWRDTSVSVFLQKRVFSLLIPYIFFEALGILTRFVLYGQALSLGLYNMATIRCNVGADWFLPAMFIGSFLTFIYSKVGNSFWGIASVVFALTIVTLLPDNQAAVMIGRGLLAYVFIMVGLAGKKLFLSEKLGKPYWILISFLITSACVVVNLKFGGNDFYVCTIHNPITLLIGGIAGTCMILGWARLLSCQNKGEVKPDLSERCCKWLMRVGRETLIIMGTHQLVIYGMTAMFAGFTAGSLMMGVVLFVVILIFEFIVVYLLNRFLPFFVGRRV